MTYNYSATFYTCWQEFEDRLKEGNPLLNNTQLQLIKQDYKAFYKFLDDLFNKQNIFTNSLDGLTQDLLGSYEENKQITIQSTDKATIHLHYLISVSRR